MFKNLRRSRTAVVGVCCALAGAAVVPVVGLATISGSTGDGPMVLQSGQSSATYQASFNISSLPATTFKQNWSRVGDTVTVTGAFPVLAGSAGAGDSASVYIPLPVASTFTDGPDCSGAASINSTISRSGRIFASLTSGHTNQCVVEWPTASTAEQWVHYSMTYRVKG